MAIQSKRIVAALLCLSNCWLISCGRDLSLEPRVTVTPDDLIQNYAINIFATSSIASNYTVTATFSTAAGTGQKILPLPAGDSFAVNGTPLTYSESTETYSTSGSGNPGTFAFVWTHEGITMSNTVTATLYPPSSVPRTVSKSTGVNVQVLNVPKGVTVSGTVNAGTQIVAPFVAIPIVVSGGGTATEVVADYRGLSAGPGVLTLVETYSQSLQSPTQAGGSGIVTVQFGYYVTITD